MRLTTLTFATALVALATTASAQSLEVKKSRAGEEAKMATTVALTNQRCGGTAIKVQFNWSSFNEAEILKISVAPFCQAALDAIEDLCGEETGKSAIKEKVKTVTCGGAAGPNADFADGNVTFNFALGPNQNKLLVRDMLEKKL